MYDSNLVYWLKSELHGMVLEQIDSTKIRDEKQYFRIFESKKEKIMRDYDFIELSIPQEYLQLNEQQKESIREFAKVFLVEKEDFERHLSFVCHVGYCFEKADLNDSPECKAILANYQYLKELWKERYPTEFEGFEVEKRESHIEAKQPQQIRPNCPECKSTDIISKGNQWMCKSCGRSWLKQPRLRNRQIPNQEA